MYDPLEIPALNFAEAIAAENRTSQAGDMGRSVRAGDFAERERASLLLALASYAIDTWSGDEAYHLLAAAHLATPEGFHEIPTTGQIPVDPQAFELFHRIRAETHRFLVKLRTDELYADCSLVYVKQADVEHLLRRLEYACESPCAPAAWTERFWKTGS